MAIELTGKIILLLNPQSGTSARGEWKKQEFVIETDEQYPKKICISAWNDRAAKVAQIPVGTPVRVSVNIESREYNSKWYTDVRVWDIQVDNGEGGGTIDREYTGTAYSDSAAPAGPYATNPVHSSMADPVSAPQPPMPDESDELPF